LTFPHRRGLCEVRLRGIEKKADGEYREFTAAPRCCCV
jgi:hypothetical protein